MGRGKRRGKMKLNPRKILIVSLAIAAVLLYGWRLNLAIRAMNAPYDSRVGEEIELTGIVSSLPEREKFSLKLTVRPDGGEKIFFLVRTAYQGEIKYGDLVKFSGRLSKPENFVSQSGRIFDYVHYLAKDRIYYIINNAEAEVLASGKGNPVKKILFGTRNSFASSIHKILPPPESTLLEGLLLGNVSFSEKLNEAFVRTGTIHIVALSGFNVTIVAEAIMRLLKIFLSSLASIYAGVISIVLFAVMTGAGSTIVRASIMAILALLARATGRTYDATRALFIAGFIMILESPLILFHDISFQLSFLATLGIIHLSPRFEKYFYWMPKILELPKIAATTLAAYFFVLPFLLYKMGTLSVVALPVNILILPFLPMTMFFGFSAGLLGLIGKALSFPFAYISHLLLGYELGVIKWFASLKFAAINLGLFSPLLVILAYLFFIPLFFMKRRAQNSPQSLSS
jgi:competence protein ComEC